MAAISFVKVVEAGSGYTKVLASDGNTYTLKGDRNWRNNNPGNIEYGNFAKSMGAIGTDGRFAVFPTAEQGNAARTTLQFQSPSYADKTIAEAISRYAPASENDTQAYINAVSAAAGVPSSTKMSDLTPQQQAAFLAAQSKVEGMTPGKIVGEPGVPVPAAVARQFSAIPLPSVGIPVASSYNPTRASPRGTPPLPAPSPLEIPPSLGGLQTLDPPPMAGVPPVRGLGWWDSNRQDTPGMLGRGQPSPAPVNKDWTTLPVGVPMVPPSKTPSPSAAPSGPLGRGRPTSPVAPDAPTVPALSNPALSPYSTSRPHRSTSGSSSSASGTVPSRTVSVNPSGAVTSSPLAGSVAMPPGTRPASVPAPALPPPVLSIPPAASTPTSGYASYYTPGGIQPYVSPSAAPAAAPVAAVPLPRPRPTTSSSSSTSSAPRPAATITGSSTGRSYEVGRTYTTGAGIKYVATSTGFVRA